MKKFILAVIVSLCSCSMTIAENYTISNAGKEHIKKYESLHLTSYWDNGAYSIGYGHRSADITKNMTISKKQADQFFDQDIKEAERYANLLIKKLPYQYSFSQNFFDALVSYVYNVGYGNALKSDFYKKLKLCRVKKGMMNVNDYNYTIAHFKTSYTSHKGNVKRRAVEYKMMLASI